MEKPVLAGTPIRSWKNLSTTPTPIKLRAGFYLLTVRAERWGGGSVTVQRLSADGSTFETAFKPFLADSSAQAFLVSGAYQLTIDLATDVSADLFLTEAH
jgi:hypothetical protein